MAFNVVQRVPDLVATRNVLVSAYDKTALADFARGLAEACPGLRFFATGGSYDALSATLGAGAAAEGRLVAVSSYTGQPEMSGGLVKTLDWKIYLGLLAEPGDASHAADLARSGALAFDMVVANLYPFEAAVSDPAATAEARRQRIDIGGPAMLRAAAKNFLRVAAVSDPGRYGEVLAELRSTGGRTSLALRRRLAAAAFALTARFDAGVAAWLGSLDETELSRTYEPEG